MLIESTGKRLHYNKVIVVWCPYYAAVVANVVEQLVLPTESKCRVKTNAVTEQQIFFSLFEFVLFHQEPVVNKRLECPDVRVALVAVHEPG